MVQQQNVEFAAENDVILRGWLFVPDGPGPHPAITMAHGFAGVKEHGLERFAQVFAAAGFVVLVHDHRGFGASGGSPRYDIDPWVQIADWRRAISFLESQPFVDPDRIGLWGSSYAGGHAIVLGATDRRLRAVVAQVPTISGYQQSLRRVAPDQVAALERRSPTTNASSFTARHRPPRPWSVPTRPYLPPIVRPTLSRSIPSRSPKGFGTTSSHCARPVRRACMSREPGSPGSPQHPCSWSWACTTPSPLPTWRSAPTKRLCSPRSWSPSTAVTSTRT